MKFFTFLFALSLTFPALASEPLVPVPPHYECLSSDSQKKYHIFVEGFAISVFEPEKDLNEDEGLSNKDTSEPWALSGQYRILTLDGTRLSDKPGVFHYLIETANEKFVIVNSESTESFGGILVSTSTNEENEEQVALVQNLRDCTFVN